MVRTVTIHTCFAALTVVLLFDSLQAQEMFNVNIWSIGRPASRGGIWGDGFDDEEELATLLLDGATEAGAPGWRTVEWENVELDPNPFAKLTPATTINGTAGSTATFEMFNRRNAASYNWNNVRDDSDVEDVGNATLLDGHVNSTEFDNSDGSGNPFGFQISDFEIRDIPFASYEAVIYLGINSGQTFSGNGTIRINDEVDRPSDPTDWGFGVMDEGPLDDSGGTLFTIPTTFQDFEPDGTLDEIEFSGDVGNYIIYTGLSGPTLKVQTWGEAFTHLGIAGFQIRQVGGSPGDYNADGEVDVLDIDLQAQEMQSATPDLGTFDENGDGMINYADREIWIVTHANTWVGDANLDGEFNSSDFVKVFTAGKYETAQPAGWAEGDWNGDLSFTSSDFVAAFSNGGYEVGPRAALRAVPEPASFAVFAMGMLLIGLKRNQQAR